VAMADPYRDGALVNWVGDFTGSDRVGLFPPSVQEVAQAVLETLLLAACGQRDVAPAELTQDDLKTALLDHVATLEIPAEAKPFVPSLCRAFLEDLQRQGRLGSGQTLGRYVGALKEAFLAATPGKPTTYRRPGSKVGRNDLCPCGSGQKFKKCHGA
jgi:hypothetical protein